MLDQLLELQQLVMRNSVLFGISMAVISTFVNQLVMSFINDIILPIIDRDGNDDKKPDIDKISDYIIKTNGITFRVGAFIVALIRFIILLFIIFTLSIVLIKMKK